MDKLCRKLESLGRLDNMASSTATALTLKFRGHSKMELQRPMAKNEAINNQLKNQGEQEQAQSGAVNNTKQWSAADSVKTKEIYHSASEKRRQRIDGQSRVTN